MMFLTGKSMVTVLPISSITVIESLVLFKIFSFIVISAADGNMVRLRKSINNIAHIIIFIRFDMFSDFPPYSWTKTVGFYKLYYTI
jgi:hypothetical protein